MPAEARQAYEQAIGLLTDKNQNGTPDVLEGAMTGAPAKISLSSSVRVNTTQTIVFKDRCTTAWTRCRPSAPGVPAAVGRWTPTKTESLIC